MKRVAARASGGVALALASALLSQSSLPSLCCAQAAVTACDATWSAYPTLFEAGVLVGDGPFQRDLTLPPDREVLVLASEKGADVILTLKGDGREYSADSPLYGFGVQRVFASARSPDWTLTLVGKDDDSAGGFVDVRVVAVPASRDQQECVEVQRQLASADIAFARAWSISNAPDAAGLAGDAQASYLASIEAYQRAFARLGSQPQSVLRAALRLAIGSAYYWGLHDWAAADSWAKQAVKDHEALGDARGTALAQALRGMALIEIDPAQVPGSLALAAQLLRTAAEVHATRGELREQASALNNLGISQYLAGDYPAATVAYSRAMTLLRKLGKRGSLWQVMDNAGMIDYELGNLGQARQTYAELLEQPGLRTRPALYANVLTNSALVDLESGEAGKALQSYLVALQAATSMQSTHYEAVSLQGIGGAYDALGDPDLALNFYGRALALRSREAEPRLRVETLRTIADIERRKGHAGESLKLDLEALELAGTDLDRQRLRLQIAADHAALGQHAEAQAQLETAIAQRVAGDDFVHARALLLRGRLRSKDGNWKAARNDLAAAQQSFEDFESAGEQFNTRMAIAEMSRNQGNLDAALREVETAIELAEKMRLQSANPGLRASLLETLRPAFDLKIELLGIRYATARTPQARRQLALDALRVAERARSRSLQDYTRMDFAGAGDATETLAKRRAMYEQLRQYQARLESAATLAADAKVLATIRGDAADLRRRIDQVESELAGSGSSPLDPVALELPFGKLPAGLALIEYWLGSGEAYAWVATRDSLEMVHLGPSGAITTAALTAQRSLQDIVSTTATERVGRMQALSALIWAPLRLRAAQQRTLVFVPDMALHYIPFAALVDGAAPGRFLIENHDVATTPSLRLLLATGRGTGTPADRMLLVADPDYGDAPRLKGTAREADAIAAIVSAGRADRLQGRQATRQRFLGAGLENYRYIHVASHAVADARVPQLSSLQLASVDERGTKVDGQVFAADLLGVRLNADLVVLSACETALGRVVSGEGVIGLRYLLLARGAHAVVSSLWRIGDRYTQELMAGFYTSLFRESRAAPAALGATMRAAIGRHGADPALWAGFDLAVRDLDLVL